MRFRNNSVGNLFLVGMSHWNTPVDIREQFSLSKEQTLILFESAKAAGVNSIFSISTCNRTEIYAIAKNAEQVVELFLNASNAKHQDEKVVQHLYIKQVGDAVEHLLKVSAGLDAQILGDAQITGQIREFHQLALNHGMLDAVLNRLVEVAISAGKQVKTQMELNTGAATIAYAAVNAAVGQYAKKEFKALIIGSGKTGKLVLKSLLKFISSENVTMLNRTNEVSAQLASEYSVRTSAFNALKNEIEKADVIFAATAAPKFLITNELLPGVILDNKLFVDLSLPRNIEPSLKATVIDLDRFPGANNEHREKYLEVAKKTISAGIAEYNEWLHRYELAQNVKSQIAESIFDNGLDDDEAVAPSKFVDGITSRHLRHFQKGKQSRNLAA